MIFSSLSHLLIRSSFDLIGFKQLFTFSMQPADVTNEVLHFGKFDSAVAKHPDTIESTIENKRISLIIVYIISYIFMDYIISSFLTRKHRRI